jgi:dynein heavy chain, axonemal
MLLFNYRGSHSATLIGSRMYVFGGYGGTGFARKDFNDVSVLNLETWEWNHTDCKGDLPEPRSGHQVSR